ncbi:MAG: S41 family peptidase [Bacteroidales bacterium]|nr:S41 family peptidase [Bacteroidales bacterium]NLM93288.1 S41 family peptidase [Bacteroidales bacterium]
MKLLKKIHKKTRILLLVLALSGSAVAMTAFNSQNFEIAKNLDIFASLFREIVVNYVDDVNPSELVKTGIDEMLYSLDPYTNFIPESQIEDMRFMTTGQYGGIGALITTRDDYTIITEPYEGFPAHKAGLLPGDRILEISGQSVLGKSSEDVRELLKGQPGTTLTLLIEREGEPRPLLRDVTREVVKISNIPYYGMLDEKTGYIKLTGFTQNAGREVRDAFNELRQKHRVESIILDLRGNGGGLLNEAVNITNLFVEKDELVVSTRGKIAERNTNHNTLNNPIDTEIPLVVLVNRGSASASEIVAGAIQDFDRGVILGQRTFGKGLVQNVVPLSYNTQLKVTVAKYYIPSGRCIQAIDYAQRNEDGSVAMIPDSLKKAFTTRNGRVVYDGGGIEPDVPVDPQILSNISFTLANRFLIFDYANHFFRTHQSIPPAAEFEITDAVYSDFVNFLSDKDYDYVTRSENLMEELREASANEKYFSAIESEYEALKQKMIHNKEEDLLTFRDEISMLLKEEIVSRYYYQKGRVLASLSMDPDIDRALEILSNGNGYRRILAGQQ